MGKTQMTRQFRKLRQIGIIPVYTWIYFLISQVYNQSVAVQSKSNIGAFENSLRDLFPILPTKAGGP